MVDASTVDPSTREATTIRASLSPCTAELYRRLGQPMITASGSELRGSLSLFEVAQIPSRGPCVIDLRSISFSTPRATVALIVKIEAIRRRGDAVTVLAPLSSDVANYLCRAHLPLALDSLGVAHDFGAVGEHFVGDALVELARVDDPDSINGLARSVYKHAAMQDKDMAVKLHDAVCEAGENALAHSRTGHGYVMAQRFPRVNKFEFAIGDSGVGLLTTLGPRGAQTYDEAILLAVTPGVTATDEPTRGYGISTIRQGLDSVGGTLTIASGDAYRTFSGSDQGQPGVVVGLQEGVLLYSSIRTR